MAVRGRVVMDAVVEGSGRGVRAIPCPPPSPYVTSPPGVGIWGAALPIRWSWQAR